MQKNTQRGRKHLLAVVRKHWFISGVVFLAIFWFIYVLLTPASNNRNWRDEVSIMPDAIISENIVSIFNIRNQTYNSSGPVLLSYYNQSFDILELQNLSLYVASLSGFKGIAHTFFEFAFINGTRITLSVEARREVGEVYSIWTGLLREFEVFYVWSPVSDGVARRQVWQRPKMIAYQIKSDPRIVQLLFLQLIADTNELNERPRFYNTLFSTCTSNLLEAARVAYPDGLPWTISRYLPGYATEYLYGLNLIETNLSLEMLESNYLPPGNCCGLSSN